MSLRVRAYRGEVCIADCLVRGPGVKTLRHLGPIQVDGDGPSGAQSRCKYTSP